MLLVAIPPVFADEYLDHNLVVNKGEVLELRDATIRLLGTSHIIVNGTVIIDNVTMTSWDNATQAPIEYPNPRGYLLVNRPDGNTSITNSEIAYLGMSCGPKDSSCNGLVYYETDPKYSHLISNNSIHDMYDGFYARGLQNMEIAHNLVYNNSRYGLDPHTITTQLYIHDNEVHDNAKMGIICSNICNNITVANNFVYANGGAGIMLSKQTNHSLVEWNSVVDEVTGISVSNSHNNTVRYNYIEDVNNGIDIKENSSGNQIYDNEILHAYDADIRVMKNVSDNFIASDSGGILANAQSRTQNTIVNGTDVSVGVPDLDTLQKMQEAD